MNELAGRLIDSFAKFPERSALEVGGEALTYRELAAKAWAFAQRLEAQTPPTSRIGILAQRSVAAYVAILGAILSGRPYVPINPKFPRDRQRAIADAAKCAGFAFDDKTAEAAQSLSDEFGGCVLGPDDGVADQQEIGGNGVHAYIMFTSGTTGTPKGVAVRYDNVTSYIDAFRKIAPVEPDDRCTQLFDLSFDLSVHDMMITWTSGACLCVPSDSDLIDPTGFAARNAVTCWFSVPSVVGMAKRMRRLSPGLLPSIRLSLFCGEALSTSVAASWSETAANSVVWNLYGPTEATIAITAYRFDADGQDGGGTTVPLGEAYDGCAVVAVGPSGAAVGPGAEGELLLGGAQLTDGYVNNPAEQRAKFIELSIAGYPFDRWYRSGDLVRVDPHRGLVYLGRSDDQVKIAGYRVELLEIEEVLRKAADNPEVAAVPWPIGDGGSASGLVGFIAGQHPDAREIIKRCRTDLAAYMVPKKIISVDQLPVNSNGKIDRRALRKQYLDGTE